MKLRFDQGVDELARLARLELSLAARVVAQRLNADTSDQAGPTWPCACGQPARYAGRRPKAFSTVLGPLTLERAYYHCAACAAGFCPRDQALGLEGTSLSPAVTRMVGVAGPLADEVRLLADLPGRREGGLPVDFEQGGYRRRSVQHQPRICLLNQRDPVRIATCVTGGPW